MLEIAEKLRFSWFDLLVLILLVIGFLRGRHHGMSEELLPLLQVLAMVVVSAYYYEPLGILYAQAASISILMGHVTAYLTFVLIIKFLFAIIIKRAVGERIISSDLFGRMEYYLGMVAGVLRFAGIVLIGLSLLNARASSPQQKKAEDLFTEEVVGQMTFPTFSSLQDEVFTNSFSGRFVKEHLDEMLIEPVKPYVKVGSLEAPKSTTRPAKTTAPAKRTIYPSARPPAKAEPGSPSKPAVP